MGKDWMSCTKVKLVSVTRGVIQLEYPTNKLHKYLARLLGTFQKKTPWSEIAA